MAVPQGRGGAGDPVEAEDKEGHSVSLLQRQPTGTAPENRAGVADPERSQPTHRQSRCMKTGRRGQAGLTSHGDTAVTLRSSECLWGEGQC